ncbi:MAG: hypothetical protein AB1792_05780 [Candidatus Zixiibacteriota bacterium]
MSVVSWIALAASIVAYRVWFPDTPAPPRMRLDYDLMVIALIGLNRGRLIGTFSGWAIGFLAAAGDPGRLVWGSLLGAGAGWIVGFWKERLFLEYTFSRWLILWSVLLVAKAFQLLFQTGWDLGLWLSSLWSGALASAGLTATAGVGIAVLWERARPRRFVVAPDQSREESL